MEALVTVLFLAIFLVCGYICFRDEDDFKDTWRR